MEVEFDEAVSVIKIAKGYRYLKKKERKIANICFLLMCAGTVISIIDYYFRKQDMSIFYAFFFIIFGIIVVIYMYSKKSIRDIENMISSAISFYQKNSKLDKLILETKELKNLVIYRISKTISRKVLIGITLPSGNIPEVGFVGEEFKKFERQYGPGKCYSFSTLFHSIPKSYAKFSNLPVEKKLKGGRIKNPGIEKVIRKLKPRWLDPKKDLIRSFDLYSFQSNGKTYYALEIVFDEELVKSNPREVYDFYVKVVKEIERSKAN